MVGPGGGPLEIAEDELRVARRFVERDRRRGVGEVEQDDQPVGSVVAGVRCNAVSLFAQRYIESGLSFGGMEG